jgi:hypothetical protein
LKIGRWPGGTIKLLFRKLNSILCEPRGRGTNPYDVSARHSWQHSPVIMSRDFWPFQHPLSEKNSTILCVGHDPA